MKKLLYAVPVMLLAAHASVFAGGGNEEAGVGQVTVWGWRTQDRPVWDAVSETLSSRGVTIEYQAFTPTEYDAKLQVSLQGGPRPICFSPAVFPAIVLSLSLTMSTSSLSMLMSISGTSATLP